MPHCRTLEMLARGTGLRGDATRAPMQVRNEWRLYRRHLTRPASPSKDDRFFVQTMGSTSDGATVTHNTLSADVTHVRVFYPFHPLYGYSLRVLRRPRRGDGAVVVLDPAGKRLKIPVWMLLPNADHPEVAEQAHLSK